MDLHLMYSKLTWYSKYTIHHKLPYKKKFMVMFPDYSFPDYSMEGLP